jgi:membrane protease subunit HflC
MRRLVLTLFVLLGSFIALISVENLGLWNRGPLVITNEGEQKLVLRFDEAVRVTRPGLEFIIPFVEKTQTYDRRWLFLDTKPTDLQTRDGEQLTIDNYAVWRVEDAIAFRRAFPQGIAQAESRIDRAMRDDVREVIGRHTLHQVLDSKRNDVMREIAAKTRENVSALGIAIADVRINRTDLPEQTRRSVYERMKTERERLARKSRAEGDEQARMIRAKADAQARVIVANARRDSEIARGQGDAEATAIYAAAYGADPDFYGFVRSLEAYRKSINEGTTLVLSPRSEFFQFLESSSGHGAR